MDVNNDDASCRGSEGAPDTPVPAPPPAALSPETLLGPLAVGIAHEISSPVQYVGDNLQFIEASLRDLIRLAVAVDGLRAARERGSMDARAIESVLDLARSIEIQYLSEELPRALEQSRAGLEQVAAMIRSIRMLAHPSTRQFQRVKLNSLVEAAIALTRNQWKTVGALDLHLDPSTGTSGCIPAELTSVVVNLIVNAAQAIAERREGEPTLPGRITVTTKRVDNENHILVADNGIGIPDAVKHRVFERSFTTKAPGKGTGVGLALARTWIVDGHGGRIEFESKRGQGTTFVVRLPLGGPGVTGAGSFR